MPVATYYFDASIAGPTDPNAVWTNEADIFDASDATSGFTSTDGSKTTNYIEGKGTNATGSDYVMQVRGRVRHFTGGSAGYSAYVTLTAPGGSWDWTKVGDLEVRLWAISLGSNSCTAEIYASGDSGGTALATIPTTSNGAGSYAVYKVEIEVTSGDPPVTPTLAWFRA